jgi:hypothetical protein
VNVDCQQALQHTTYDEDKLTGIAIRLAAGKPADMASIAEMRLPVPVRVLASSTVTLEPAANTNSYSSPRAVTITLKSDVQGNMLGDTGVMVAFSRRQLDNVGLLDEYSTSDDLRTLEAMKQRTLKLTVEFKLAPA